MSEFKIIESQEELDRIISDRLKREREKYADYEELKSKADTYADLEKKLKDLEKQNAELHQEIESKSKALEKSKSEFESYEKELTAERLQNLRVNVALSHGLPYELASRLQGEDEEQMIQDAEKFAEFIQRKEPVAPLKDVEGTNENNAYANMLSGLEQEYKGE